MINTVSSRGRVFAMFSSPAFAPTCLQALRRWLYLGAFSPPRARLTRHSTSRTVRRETWIRDQRSAQ